MFFVCFGVFEFAQCVVFEEKVTFLCRNYDVYILKRDFLPNATDSANFNHTTLL